MFANADPLVQALLAGVETVLPEGVVWDARKGELAYYDRQGRLNRDPDEGPALQWGLGLGGFGSEAYLVEDMFHRDTSAGPARTIRGGLTHGGSVEYWVNGELHRDLDDGPARIVDGGLEAGGAEVWFVRGKRHRDPREGPALSVMPGGAYRELVAEYWVDDVRYLSLDDANKAWTRFEEHGFQ